jgi:hypothetical protein
MIWHAFASGAAPGGRSCQSGQDHGSQPLIGLTPDPKSKLHCVPDSESPGTKRNGSLGPGRPGLRVAPLRRRPGRSRSVLRLQVTRSPLGDRDRRRALPRPLQLQLPPPRLPVSLARRLQRIHRDYALCRCDRIRHSVTPRLRVTGTGTDCRGISTGHTVTAALVCTVLLRLASGRASHAE